MCSQHQRSKPLLDPLSRSHSIGPKKVSFSLIGLHQPLAPSINPSTVTEPNSGRRCHIPPLFETSFVRQWINFRIPSLCGVLFPPHPLTQENKRTSFSITPLFSSHLHGSNCLVPCVKGFFSPPYSYRYYGGQSPCLVTGFAVSPVEFSFLPCLRISLHLFVADIAYEKPDTAFLSVQDVIFSRVPFLFAFFGSIARPCCLNTTSFFFWSCFIVRTRSRADCFLHYFHQNLHYEPEGFFLLYIFLLGFFFRAEEVSKGCRSMKFPPSNGLGSPDCKPPLISVVS